jgi:hypothetical protein
MLVWVILPPNFDATKSIQHFYIAKEDHKAPDAILFFPLEFSVNGCYGYIVAPNRRGMPGYGWSGMNKSVKTGADR